MMLKDMNKQELLDVAYNQQVLLEQTKQMNKALLDEKEQVEKLFEVIMPLAEEIKKLSWLQRMFKAVSLAIEIANYLINYKSNGK